jgi:hypothetical protein
MAYVSEWELLPDATNRVMATAGLSKDQAQIDICRAVADGAVRIRGKLRKHATRPTTSKAVLQGTDFQIPPEIKPSDLDWERSRPLKPWFVGRGTSNPVPGYWELDWIELSRTDVTNVLCPEGKRGETALHPSRKKGATRRSRPVFERAQAAIKELYPDRVPGQSAEPNSLLCRRVGEILKKEGLPNVSDDTILRAAGRRK